MKRIFAPTIILLLTQFYQIFAQNSPIIKAYNENYAPIKKWDKTFGGTEYEAGHSVELTDDGGYLVVGSSGSEISGNKQSASKGGGDFWVIKTNQNGVKVWEKSYGGSGSEMAKTVIKCKDGGFLIGGDSGSPQDGDKSQPAYISPGGYASNDYWILKIDANGNKLWDKRYGGNWEDYLNYVIQTQDGGYLLAGYSNSNDGGDKTENLRFGYDAWVVKVDANGNKLWDKTLGGSKYESAETLVELPDKTILVACNSFLEGVGGDITVQGKGGSDIWLVKLSEGGGVLWDKKYGSTGEESYPSIIQTNDGNIFISALTNGPRSGDVSTDPIGYDDFWLIKINVNGDKLWDKRYGGYGSENNPVITKTFDGKYLLAGQTISNYGYDISEGYKDEFDLWVVKIDENGNKYWDRRIGCRNGYFLGYNMIRPTPDLGFIFITTSNADIGVDKTENSYGENDIWVVKTVVTDLPDPICTTPYSLSGYSFVASGCSGTVNWGNGATGVNINLNNLMETTVVTVTCTENGNTSAPATFKINVAWYQRYMAEDISSGKSEYTAITTIDANNQITAPANIKYVAGYSIQLNPGFKADNGSTFSASIKSCYE